MLYSLAMLLDEDPEVLIAQFGHNGLEIWWPQYQDARQYRSHSMQEVQDVCFTRGLMLAPVDGMPMQAPEGVAELALPTYTDAEKRFHYMVAGRAGLLILENHACAWDGFMVYDPNGRTYPIENASIRSAWILGRLDFSIKNK